MPGPPACRPASRSPGAVPGSLVEFGPLRPEAGLVGRPGGPPGAAAPREVITPRALSPPPALLVAYGPPRRSPHALSALRAARPAQQNRGTTPTSTTPETGDRPKSAWDDHLPRPDLSRTVLEPAGQPVIGTTGPEPAGTATRHCESRPRTGTSTHPPSMTPSPNPPGRQSPERREKSTTTRQRDFRTSTSGRTPPVEIDIFVRDRR